MTYEDLKSVEESNSLVKGYKFLASVKGRCQGRVTIVGHRLEPRHLQGYSNEEIKNLWKLPDEVILECFRYLSELK